MKYVSVTTISMFKHRYVVSIEELQKLNPDCDIIDDPKEAVTWLKELIDDGMVDEFSQCHLNEIPVDASIAKSDDEILEIFDDENDNLSSWSPSQKLNWIKCNITKYFENGS